MFRRSMTNDATPAMNEQPASAPPRKEKRHENWETVKVFVSAILLAMLFRSFFFEPFHIPSGSMKSTLLVGDYIFVSKPAYGYSRYSFPFGLPIFEGRIFFTQPERGDVVVFRLPSNPSVDYIKRVIGLPGDKIQVKDGVLFINGKKVKREPVEDFVDEEDPHYVSRIPRYRETLPGGRQYLVLDQTRMGEVDDTPVYVVPEGHYFMMGDNRDNSTDSRYMKHVGFVPAENLVGRANIIVFSTDGSARFWEIWKWLPSLRTDRFLQGIS